MQLTEDNPADATNWTDEQKLRQASALVSGLFWATKSGFEFMVPVLSQPFDRRRNLLTGRFPDDLGVVGVEGNNPNFVDRADPGAGQEHRDDPQVSAAQE